MTDNTADDEPEGERLERLLEEARDAIASLDAGDGAPEELRDVADEVDALIADGDVSALMEATEADLPEGADPETVPEALAESDSGSVIELRLLLLLSKLSEQWGEEAPDDVLEELGELNVELSAREQDAGDGETGGSDADDGTAPETEGETMEPFEGRIESELKDAIGDFREGVESIGEKVRQREEPEAESGRDADGDAPDDGRADPARDAGAFSTLPSSNRADMRAPKRLSTVRDSKDRREE